MTDTPFLRAPCGESDVPRGWSVRTLSPSRDPVEVVYDLSRHDILIIAGGNLARLAPQIADGGWKPLGPYSDGEVWTRDRIAATRAALERHTAAARTPTWQLLTVGHGDEVDPERVAAVLNQQSGVAYAHAWRPAPGGNPITELHRRALRAAVAADLDPADPEWLWAIHSADTNHALGLHHAVRALTDPQRHRRDPLATKPTAPRPNGGEPASGYGQDLHWVVAAAYGSPHHRLERALRPETGAEVVHAWDTGGQAHPLETLYALAVDGHRHVGVDGIGADPQPYVRAIEDAITVVTGQTRARARANIDDHRRRLDENTHERTGSLDRSAPASRPVVRDTPSVGAP